MTRNREKVTSFDAADLRKFIELECEGDLSRLSKRGRMRYYGLESQKRVYYYTADEILLDMDSHLRFFEDWLNEQRTD